MKNVIDTIAAQYANSPTLRQMIDSMNEYFDPSTDFEAFYDFVWNLDTAQGFGLDIWGKIVDVRRELTISANRNYFGFEGGDESEPFDQAPFAGTVGDTDTYVLEDNIYRSLILTKALYNISGSTPASINQLLRNLFAGRGRCYVQEMGAMRIRFVFEFKLKPFEYAIMTQSGAIPRPAGVSSDILQVVPASTFGFSEAKGQPFDNGTFFNS